MKQQKKPYLDKLNAVRKEVLCTGLNNPKKKKPSSRIKHNYLKEKIIGKLDEGMRLRKKIINQVSYVCYLS